MLRNLLIYRLLLFNMSCGALVIWAWQQGLVRTMFELDRSHLTYAIAGLFVFGLVSTLVRANKVSGLLNRLKAGGPVKIDGTKLTEKAAYLDDIGHILLTLGLLGTAIGLMIALSSLDAASLGSADRLLQVSSQMADGMRTAFRSTIVSGFLWCWHLVNCRMVRTATVLLIADSGKVSRA